MTTVVEEKVFCPFCGHPLQIRVVDSVRMLPIISKRGLFQVKCRSKDCKGRWVDIDILRPTLIA